MEINRNSNEPLYVQIKKMIINSINTGEYGSGKFIPTEDEFCQNLGISKYPVRQALGELVKEGYLERTRGKGTNVSNRINCLTCRESGLLGLVLIEFSSSLSNEILIGFEKYARTKGFLTIACATSNDPEEELRCIELLIEKKCCGIYIFLCDESKVPQRIDEIRKRGVYIGLLDRNPGITDIDYVGSDNRAGAYMAARHLAHQGYHNVVFVANMFDLSSLTERFNGFKEGAEDFGLNVLTRINFTEDLTHIHFYKQRFFIEKIYDDLETLRGHLPIGILASNDIAALYCMNIFEEKQLSIGADVGIIGFDNTIGSRYSKVPLTTVAQNGLNIGQSAAECAINRIQGVSTNIHKVLIPTQLVIRKSCGEG